MKTVSTDTLRCYMDEVGRIPMLTEDESILLARRVQAMQALLQKKPKGPYGAKEKQVLRLGKKARERMVTANLRLVITVAKRYKGMASSLDIHDLIQEGTIGLIRGIERFDPERGYQVSTYIYWWIRQGITRALRYKDRSIRLPGNVGEMAYTWGAKRQKLIHELGREPTLEELGEEFRVAPEDVLLFRERGHKPLSLDQVVGEDMVIMETVADPRAEEAEEALERALVVEMADNVRKALAALTPEQRQAIELRYGLCGEEPKTLKQIGEAQGVTREASRLRLTKACNRLRFLLRTTYKTQENLVSSLVS